MMIDNLLTLLTTSTQQVFDFSQSEVQAGSLSARRRSTLGEAGLVICEILGSLNIPQIDRILLEKTLYAIYQILYDEEALFYYSSFYYSYRNVQGDSNQVQTHFVKANLDILAMRLKLRLAQMGLTGFGSSTDSYFLSRLERLTWGIKYIFRKKRSDFYIPALYVLLNLHQTLIELLGSGIDEDSEIATKLALVNELLAKLSSSEGVQEILQSLSQLRFFFVDQQYRYQSLRVENGKPPYEFDSIDFETLDWVPQLRSIRSLSPHAPDAFTAVCSASLVRWQRYATDIQPLAKILLLSVLVEWLKQIGYINPVELGIEYRFKCSVNLEEFMPSYFSAYRAIPQVDIGPDDLGRLYELNDQDLRIRVGNSMINVDPVVVQNEASKPHGAVEIADMEIPVQLHRNTTHYLCMPFKSAHEIRRKSVPVDYFYQIVRPFAFFDNCIVVFISAKKCSQPLLNLIKQIREKHNWPIGIIENTQLAALLKLNSQL